MKMIVTQQEVVKKFLENFREAYNEYFEGKDFLKKIGDRWSIIVGFMKQYYPRKKFEEYSGYIYLSVELDEGILFEYYCKEKLAKEKLKGEPYLVSRYYQQEGEKDEEIRAIVLKNVIEFINYINRLNCQKIELKV